jgi:hypothetical protein
MGVLDPAILPLSPQSWTGYEGTRTFAAEFSQFSLEAAVEIDSKSSIEEAAVKVKRTFRTARQSTSMEDRGVVAFLGQCRAADCGLKAVNPSSASRCNRCCTEGVHSPSRLLLRTDDRGSHVPVRL